METGGKNCGLNTPTKGNGFRKWLTASWTKNAQDEPRTSYPESKEVIKDHWNLVGTQKTTQEPKTRQSEQQKEQ